MEYLTILIIQIVLFLSINHYVIKRIDTPISKKIYLIELDKIILDLSLEMNNQVLAIYHLNKEYLFELQKYQKDEKWGIKLIFKGESENDQLVFLNSIISKTIGEDYKIPIKLENNRTILDFKNNIDQIYLMCRSLITEIYPKENRVLCKFLQLSDLGGIKRVKIN